MSVLKTLKELYRGFIKICTRPSSCGMPFCHNKPMEVIILKPFDPIDHSETKLWACDAHVEWVNERNKVVNQMHDELRDARTEIGMEHIDTIQKWTLAHGKIRKDILDGSVKSTDERFISIDDAVVGNE